MYEGMNVSKARELRKQGAERFTLELSEMLMGEYKDINIGPAVGVRRVPGGWLMTTGAGNGNYSTTYVPEPEEVRVSCQQIPDIIPPEEDKSIVLLEGDYYGEMVIDMEQDISDALSSKKAQSIPDEDGIPKGRFELLLKWVPEEN